MDRLLACLFPCFCALLSLFVMMPLPVVLCLFEWGPSNENLVASLALFVRLFPSCFLVVVVLISLSLSASFFFSLSRTIPPCVQCVDGKNGIFFISPPHFSGDRQVLVPASNSTY